MKAPKLCQAQGLILIINAFFPVFFLIGLFLVFESVSTNFESNTCLTLQKTSSSYETINQLQSNEQLETYYQEFIKDKLSPNTQNLESTTCIISKEIDYLVNNELYEKTKNNINKQVSSVGKKFDDLQKTIDKLTPKLPDINIPRVNLKINFPPKKVPFPARLKVDIGKPINTVISVINKIDNNINHTLATMSDAIAGTFTGIIQPEKHKIHLEILKASYKQAILWYQFKKIFISIQQVFLQFFWFAVGLCVWSFISYLFWAYARIKRGMELLTT